MAINETLFQGTARRDRGATCFSIRATGGPAWGGCEEFLSARNTAAKITLAAPASAGQRSACTLGRWLPEFSEARIRAMTRPRNQTEGPSTGEGRSAVSR